MSGPLTGLKVIEMPAIGPVPFCGMLLADLGADVLRIDRVGESDLGLKVETKYALNGRGKRSLALDLKDAKAIRLMLELIAKADVLIEGFRPGVMERLGLGPDVALDRNPKLVYGRMTGWGQEGPLASAAGHDINYIALTGALHAIGLKDGKPVPPLNLVGDFGGGSLYLAMGVLAALYERQQSGRGQVVDAAMVDGAASLMTGFYGMMGAGIWSDRRGSNILDTGAPWYDTYECKDGLFISIGSIEGKFYAELIKVLGLDPATLPKQYDRRNWEILRSAFAASFRTKSRDEWCALMEGTDICFAPVLSLEEAPKHKHMAARKTFAEIGGVVQPSPAPRFSRTPGAIRSAPVERDQGGAEALRDWGVASETEYAASAE
ncbi:MAG TPA: CaiB/BaiF CoA-transferase family protein [Ferrovibrio sp.]|uniref:CaiB/BaiF CoA transferase family protein n=1 Tax=Ferrovibrio sp. TaxID=1917215 RepID=UPI002ED3526D